MKLLRKHRTLDEIVKAAMQMKGVTVPEELQNTQVQAAIRRLFTHPDVTPAEQIQVCSY